MVDWPRAARRPSKGEPFAAFTGVSNQGPLPAQIKATMDIAVTMPKEMNGPKRSLELLAQYTVGQVRDPQVTVQAGHELESSMKKVRTHQPMTNEAADAPPRRLFIGKGLSKYTE